jgi:RNA polymerase sigma-70 factor (ECF subfamily)
MWWVEDQRVDDESLLMAAARGDGPAFGVFYRRHLPTVLAYLWPRVGSREVAADLTAETFAGALESCGRFSPGREEPAVAWLLGIARNKLRESARRRRVEEGARRRLAMPVLTLEDEDLERVERLANLGGRALELLESLPEDQRAAVRARVLDEREYPELAADLGCSEQVLRKRVSRGLGELRDLMEGSNG